MPNKGHMLVLLDTLTVPYVCLQRGASIIPPCDVSTSGASTLISIAEGAQQPASGVSDLEDSARPGHTSSTVSHPTVSLW